jgi:hypothetical protein
MERWEHKIAVAIETLVLTAVMKGKAKEETLVKEPWLAARWGNLPRRRCIGIRLMRFPMTPPSVS